MLDTQTKLRPWIVCFSAALFFLYEFIQINMFNALSPGLVQSFALNATQLGNLSATYLYSTVLCLFPIGLLLDRFSTRKLIISAMSVCIINTVLFALAPSLLLAQVFRFIAGGSGAFCFLSALILASRWFPSHRLALVTGLIVTMAMIGGVVAQTPLTLLVNHLGWRHALLCNAALGLIFLSVIYLFVQDYPANFIGKTYKQYALGFWYSIKEAVKNYQTWFCGLYTSLLNLIILVLGAVYGDGYLQTVHHLSRTDASYVTTMIFVGTIIGSPAWGFFSDKIGRRKTPMIMGAALSLLLVLFVILTPQLSFVALLILFLLLGFTTAAQIISYPAIVEHNSREIVGAAEGLANAIIMTGGALFQPFFGWIMDLHWQGTMANGVRVYTLTSYQDASWILPIAFLVSLLLALSLRETHGKSQKNLIPMAQLEKPLIDTTLQLLKNDIEKYNPLHKQDDQHTTRETLIFGYDYFGLVNGDRSFKPIPDYLQQICQHAIDAIGPQYSLGSYKDYTNVIVSIYHHDYQLKPHVDVDDEMITDGKKIDFYFGENVIGVILQADSEGKLYLIKSNDPEPTHTKPLFTLEENAGTVFLLTGTLRQKPYFHGVTKVKNMRISVTFRTVILAS